VRPHSTLDATGIDFALLPSQGVAIPDYHALMRALHEANSFPVMGRNVMGMEGDEHRLHKALVSPPFRRGFVQSRYVEPILRPLCHELIDGFASRREVAFGFGRHFCLGATSPARSSSSPSRC
jgi:cytochrome P450